MPPGLQHAKLKQIRSRGYVCLTASGLNIIGRIGHELILNHQSDWKEYTKRLGKLDWLKSNALWADIVQPKKDREGNVVTEEVTVDGHMEKRPVMQLVTNRAPLNRAILKASAAIGLGALTLGGHRRKLVRRSPFPFPPAEPNRHWLEPSALGRACARSRPGAVH